MNTEGLTGYRTLLARPGIWILGGALALFVGGGSRKLSAGWKDFEQADAVVGNRRLPDAETLRTPGDIVVDPGSGKIFVVDSAHHRVLRFPSLAAMESGIGAEAVLGQPDPVTAVPRTSQDGLQSPWRAAIDTTGRLWVLDAGNYRVVRWDNAASAPSGAPANQVLGQPDFVSRSNGGTGRMGQPTAVAVDGSGRLWVGDSRGRRVLRFDSAATKPNGAQPDGVLGQPNMTTFLTGLSARDFDEVSDLATDSQGRLWVVDSGNNRILRFDSPATGNYLPADGVLGQADFISKVAVAAESTMRSMVSVAVGADGTLFAGDYGGKRVVHWKNAATQVNGAPVDGVLGRLGTDANAGYPPGYSGSFSSLAGMALDGSGRLWVTDWFEDRALRWDNAAQRPNGALADGVIGFPTPNSVYRVQPTSGPMAPVALVEDPVSGKVFVADYARVLRYGSRAAMERGEPAEAALGKSSMNSSGSGAASDINLRSAGGLVLEGTDRLWVSDPDGNRIVAFDNPLTAGTGSKMSRVLGQSDFTTSSASTSPIGLSAPRAIALDAAGNLWVADSGNHRVVRFNKVATKAAGASADAVLGQPDLSTSAEGSEPGRMRRPRGLAIDDSGRLWVADSDRNRVLRFDAPMNVAPMADPSGALGGGASIGPRGMAAPSALVVTRAGRLWVADTSFNRVLRFEAAASKTNGAPADGVLGAPTLASGVPGTRTLDQFHQPMGLSLDATESLWVADYNNGRLLRFTPDPLASIHEIGTTPSGKVRVRFTTSGAGMFIVQSSIDLRTWTDEQSFDVGAGTELFFERAADNPARFFRVFEP